MDPAHQGISRPHHEHRAGKHAACVIGPVGWRNEQLARDNLVDHRKDHRHQHQAGQTPYPVIQNINIADNPSHPWIHVFGRIPDISGTPFGNQFISHFELINVRFLCHGLSP